MKKPILLFIALLFLVVSADANYYGVIARKNAGCTIPVSPDVFKDEHASENAISGSTAEGQSFDSGVGGRLGRICVWGIDVDTDPVFTLRIGTTDDLTTYMEEFTSGTLSTSDWVCFDSVDKDTFTGSTTYFWGAIEVSGDFALGYDTGTVTGTLIFNGTGWAMGEPSAPNDHAFRIYYCD